MVTVFSRHQWVLDQERMMTQKLNTKPSQDVEIEGLRKCLEFFLLFMHNISSTVKCGPASPKEPKQKENGFVWLRI